MSTMVALFARVRGVLGFRSLVLVVLVLVIGSLATASGAVAVRVSEQHAAREGMQRRADLTTQVVRGEILRYQDTLAMIAAALSAQQDLQRQDFDTITGTLLDARLRGAAGISYLVPSTKSRTPAVQAYWRARGATGLRLTPAPDVVTHAYSVFGRSLDGRRMTIGRDVASTPQLNQTLHPATPTKIAASEPYVLFKDQQLAPQQRQLSLVLSADVTDPDGAGFRGWVTMGLRSGDLLLAVLNQNGQDALNATLTTTGSNGEQVTLVRRNNGPATNSALVRRSSIPIGQRTWMLTMQGTDAAASRDTNGGGLVTSVLIGGALVTTLLAGLVFLLASSRQRALTAVDRATTQMRQANDRFRFAFEQANGGMVVIDMRPDRAGTLMQVNEALCVMLGRTEDDLLRHKLSELTHPQDQQRDAELFAALIEGRESAITLEKRYVRGDGATVWAEVNSRVILDADGSPAYCVAQIEDITDRRAETQRMSALALQDSLTGLGNRFLFQDHMAQATARAARSNRALGVIYCDLDLFKDVNDTHGHAAGDAVLREVAHRLLHSVRPADTVARLGGDEFAIICEDMEAPTDINRITSRIQDSFHAPITLDDGTTLRIGCSLGTATGSGRDLDISTLLHEADLDMYQNKKARSADLYPLQN